MRTPRSPQLDQRGVVLIWLAFFFLALLGVTSLAIDAAKVMAARTQLQNAADAAALAGASAVNFQTGALIPDSVVARAQLTASMNKAFVDGPVPIELDASDIEITGSQVKVTVRREGDLSVVTHIAQVLGIDALQVRADATAEVDTASTVLCGIIPIGTIPSAGMDFQTGCSNVYTLKVGGGAGTQGSYGALRYPACLDGQCAGMNPNGAATYRCLLTYGYCCDISQGQTLTTESGNISGPTTQAITTRFNGDTDQRLNICYSDYRGNGKRLVWVPITTAPSGGGTSTVTVQGFASFFLRQIPGPGNQNALIVEYVETIVPGTGQGSASSGAVVFSVRLVE